MQKGPLKVGENMKYPMVKNTERPLFEYMVIQNGEFDYYLYDKFDDALKKATELSIGHGIGLVYEAYFINSTREYRGQNTFKVFDGIVHYDKHADIGLHLEFYINAGEWLNPNEEWLKILNNRGNSRYE
jgi:hypothetical protein